MPSHRTEIETIPATRADVEHYAGLHRSALSKAANAFKVEGAEARAAGSFNDYLTAREGRPVRGDISGEDLSLSDLSQADLSQIIANATKFPAERAARETNPDLETQHALSGTKFTEADLKGADFRGALLMGQEMTDVDLSNGLLDGADATGIQLTGAKLINAQAPRTVLRDAQMHDADLTDFKAPLAVVDGVQRNPQFVRFGFDLALEAAHQRCDRDNEPVHYISEQDERTAAFQQRGGGVQQRQGWEDRVLASQAAPDQGRNV